VDCFGFWVVVDFVTFADGFPADGAPAREAGDGKVEFSDVSVNCCHIAIVYLSDVLVNSTLVLIFNLDDFSHPV